jgi:lipoprotein-releasing system permease protein
MPIYIGLRYSFAKTRKHYVSLISLVSVLGIALGITVLITVLSVMNGFDREIKKQVFSMVSPITISGDPGPLYHWQKLYQTLHAYPDISAVAPFTSKQGMLTDLDMTQPVMLMGIIPSKERAVSGLAEKMLAGNLSSLKQGSDGIIVGKALADKLHVTLGDRITVAVLQISRSVNWDGPIVPRFQVFYVTGIFQAGGGSLDFDAKMAFIHLADSQKLFGLHSAISGFRLNIKDIYEAPHITHELQTQLSSDLQIWDWTAQLGAFFENIKTTKTILFFIFILFIAVALFNLICTMIMMVKDKQPDIAILRTLGATPMMVLAIFIIQGTTISAAGVAIGIMGGTLLASNISIISTWLQHCLHMQLLSSQVYFVNYLPSDLRWSDVAFICSVTLVLSLMATLYPAWNASRIEPAAAVEND